MAKTKFAAFNAADYLDNEEVIAEYLAAALEDPDPEAFMMAVSNVAKARGIAKIAREGADMALTEHDIELFAARIRVHFPADQRDIAYELAHAIARAVGPRVKRLTPETSLTEILAWWKADAPFPSGDSLDQVEWIMALEEEFGPAFVLPDEFAGRLDRTTFKDLVEHVIRERRDQGHK